MRTTFLLKNKPLILSLLVTIGFLSSQSAFSDTVGGGISLGTGSGLSFFYQPTDSERAYQALLNLNTDGDFSLHADMLFPLVIESDPHWDAYWGVGALVGNYRKATIKLGGDLDDEDNVYVGGRIPFNIVYYIPNTPLQVGAELAPTIVVSSNTYGYLHAAVMVRLIFKL